MRYFKCKWIHSNPDEPVWLYSELNDANREVRKVEVYADGRKGFASELESVHGSFLGLEPVPPIDEIASDPEFEPAFIKRDEFERVWESRATPGTTSE